MKHTDHKLDTHTQLVPTAVSMRRWSAVGNCDCAADCARAGAGRWPVRGYSRGPVVRGRLGAHRTAGDEAENQYAALGAATCWRASQRSEVGAAGRKQLVAVLVTVMRRSGVARGVAGATKRAGV